MLLLLRYGEWAADLNRQQGTIHVCMIAAMKQYDWLSKTASCAMEVIIARAVVLCQP
jgi:hypothetical protein